MIKDLMVYQSDIEEELGFVLLERHIPAGTDFPLHWHDYIEFEIVVSGSARHVYNGNAYTISEGSAYMMSYYDFHGVTALTDLELYSIHFNRNMLHPDLIPFLDFNRFRCRFDPPETDHIVKKLLQLSTESQKAQPFYKILVQNILSEIVVLMIRKCKADTDHATPQPVLQAVAYINDNFQRDLTLTELADHLSFSPNYLGQLFKNQTGRTFNEYLNTLRLKYACRLLSLTDLTVKEVAFTSGYSSVEYFLSVFKKKMMMTPNAYRKLS
ncbi:MAG: AraC family transcriptional regulator [Lachnospiraceae bacterium]|nr:AraC family transcriptional regulator [Lachnospiraceae bacterium]